MKPLKKKYDPAMPTKKSNLYSRYLEWQHWSVLHFEDTATEITREEIAAPWLAEKEEEDDEWDENKYFIAAMLMINWGPALSTCYLMTT